MSAVSSILHGVWIKGAGLHWVVLKIVSYAYHLDQHSVASNLLRGLSGKLDDNMRGSSLKEILLSVIETDQLSMHAIPT